MITYHTGVSLLKNPDPQIRIQTCRRYKTIKYIVHFATAVEYGTKLRVDSISALQKNGERQSYSEEQIIGYSAQLAVFCRGSLTTINMAMGALGIESMQKPIEPRTLVFQILIFKHARGLFSKDTSTRAEYRDSFPAIAWMRGGAEAHKHQQQRW